VSKVLGVRELQAEIERFAKDLAAAEDPAAMAAAEPIKDAWKGLVPVLEGHYRDSLAVVWLPTDQKAGIGTSWVPGLARDEQPVMYAKKLEFGTSGQAAQPSARPALAQSQAAALQAAQPPLQAVIKGRRPRRRRIG